MVNARVSVKMFSTLGRNEKTCSFLHSRSTYSEAAEMVSRLAEQANAMFS